jgi:glycine cleavage system regulatory protein
MNHKISAGVSRSKEWKATAKKKELAEMYYQLEQKFSLVLLLLIVFIGAYRAGALDHIVSSLFKANASTFEEKLFKMDKTRALVTISSGSHENVFNIETVPSVGITKANLTIKELEALLKSMKELQTIHIRTDRKAEAGHVDDVENLAAKSRLKTRKTGQSQVLR